MSRALVGLEAGGQPVALGPGRHPGRLARIGGPPELAALGIDPGALPCHRNALLDRRQVVDQPDAVDQAGGRRIADVGHLAERPRAR